MDELKMLPMNIFLQRDYFFKKYCIFVCKLYSTLVGKCRVVYFAYPDNDDAHAYKSFKLKLFLFMKPQDDYIHSL